MSDINTAPFWDDAYRDERDGWDMGTPTPVFADLLDRLGRDFRSIGTEQFAAGSRVLVPCSGRGYDALLLARHGFSVTAVDFAEEPLLWLRGEAERMQLPVEILQEDMFTLGQAHAGRYDLLLEYTCVCAIDPARRDEFIAFASAVLRPGGTVVALLFPVDGRPGGPPFSIDAAAFKRAMDAHFALCHEEIPTTSVRPRLGKERLLVWRKKER